MDILPTIGAIISLICGVLVGFAILVLVRSKQATSEVVEQLKQVSKTEEAQLAAIESERSKADVVISLEEQRAKRDAHQEAVNHVAKVSPRGLPADILDATRRLGERLKTDK